MYGYIYKTKNKLDERIYVGQKKGNFNPKYLGSGKHFRLAVHKYGKDNFTLEVIASALSKDELDRLEKEYIAYYRKVLGEDKLFNIAAGGRNDRVFTGKFNPMYGSHRSGSANPNWKGGVCQKKYFCIDCNKEIWRGFKRCKSCVGKLRDNEHFVKMAKARGAPWNKGLIHAK